MEIFENIPLVIFLVIVAALFSWQWRKTRKLHKDFLNQPKAKREAEESNLYLDPVKNAYVRSQPQWLIWGSIILMILILVLLGIRIS